MGSRGTPHLVLSNGAAFAVLNMTGDIRGEHNPESGFFYDDTRYLSRSTLEIQGAKFRELSSEVTREYVAQIDLSLSGEAIGGELDDPKLSFHLRRRQLIDKDLVERIELTNYNRYAVDITLLFRHEADYRDLFEVRGLRRARRGELYPPAVTDAATYEFHYRGLDEQDYRTRVRYERAPDRIEPGMASFRVHLQPLGSWSIEYSVSVGRDQVDRLGEPAPFARRVHRLTEAHQRWHADATLVETDDDYFTQSLERGLSDLYSLCLDINGMKTVSAGIPWFAAPFGRDGLISSFQGLPLHATPARETLIF